MELNRFTAEELSGVLKVEILGEPCVKNLMDMFLTNEALILNGDITLQGLNTLDIIKENCAKILMWDSIIDKEKI